MRSDTLRLRRAQLEARIEEMIALLDALDGDENLEECGDDEPSVGSVAVWVNGRPEHDLEDDPAENEPDLGWSNPRFPGESVATPDGWSYMDAPDTVNSGGFHGDGQRIARKMLRKLKAA